MTRDKEKSTSDTSSPANRSNDQPKHNTNTSNDNDKPQPTESRTTILPPGTVESRNPTNPNQRHQISNEIKAFLSGTDGNGATLGITSEFRTFFTIWMFITRLPSPSWIDLHPGFLMRGMSYFPIVGSVLGMMYAVAFDFGDVSLGLPSVVAASFAVGFGLYLTGCFHEDGLADSADGMGGGWSKSQVLKIMTDSRVGTFGCAALGMFLFVKVHLLGFLGESRWVIYDFGNFGEDGDGSGSSEGSKKLMSSGAGPAILVAQTLARLSAPYLIRTRDYVAEVGPKSPFYIFMVEAKYLVTWPRVIIATSYSFALSTAFYGPQFSLCLVLAVLMLAHFMGSKGEYLLGGVMGDFLGGTICLCEVLVLTLIVAKDSISEVLNVAIDTISSNERKFHLGLMELHNNSRIRPVFNFFALLLFLKVWCSYVGPPDMYDREDGSKDSKDKKS